MSEMARPGCAVLELVRPCGISPEAGWLCYVQPSGLEVAKESMVKVVNQAMLAHAVKHTQERLLVSFSEPMGEILPPGEDKFVRGQVPVLYTELWDLVLDNDKLDLDAVVLLHGTESFIQSEAGREVELVWSAGAGIDTLCTTSFPVSDGNAAAPRLESLASVLKEAVYGVPYVLYDNLNENMPLFDTVAVGGTFDHFHNGHKMLLTICCTVCTKELVCGVTDSVMLKDKKQGDLIEPLEDRKASVKRHLDAVASPELKTTIVAIQNVWGPTVERADIQAIICSTEVLKGARLINEERVSRGFDPLEVVAVARTNAHTLSSTYIRHRNSSI